MFSNEKIMQNKRMKSTTLNCAKIELFKTEELKNKNPHLIIIPHDLKPKRFKISPNDF